MEFYDDTTTELRRLIHDFHCTKYNNMLFCFSKIKNSSIRDNQAI